MARGIDERHNENRRPKTMDEWIKIGKVDRRQGYIDALVEQNKDMYPNDTEYNPETDPYHKDMLPTAKAVTYGRTYQTPSGKWGFEWENRAHPEDNAGATDQVLSNKSDLRGFISAMRDMDSLSSAADTYYSSMRRASAMEHYGEDYNAYRAWEAGEIPDERDDEPAPYVAPEGWVAWPNGLAISNVEGTRHRLTEEFNTPAAARRRGRKLHSGQKYKYKDHEYQSDIDLSYPYEVTGMQHL